MPLSYDYNITILYYHIDIHIIAPQNKEKDNLGRNLMTEEKKTNQQEIDTGFRTPDGDYQPSINKHLARLSFVKVTENETSLTRKYTVGSMNYTVRSVFPRADKPTIEDSLKHLMTREVENVS